jgi:prevent-host-death family protein
MATLVIHHKKKTAPPKKKAPLPTYMGKARQIAAGEFKAKCLAIIDEVNQTGQEVIITKRGKATAKLVPFERDEKEPFLGRLKGIIKIVGDPDDLVKPIIPLEDWDMLK